MLWTKVGRINAMWSSLPRKGPRSWLTRYWVLPEDVGPTISALNGMLFVSIYILTLHRLEPFVHDVHLSIADCESVAIHISRARFLSVNLKEHTVFGVHKTDAASVHCGFQHGPNVDEQLKLVWVEPREVHFACDIFGLKVPADLLPHMLRFDAVDVFFFVGRAVHRDAHFDDVRVNVFFRITGAADVGFDKEQKNTLERPALRDHPVVEPAVLVLVKGHHSFSHDVVKG